ncbi:TetR/AcrR family transcriptional regulator [Haloferula chungangensis]|uniref:TetR/AcrR family transcriptional regulator n=1 Tax=Haloferula chungangensis TaxID=1048331 RepID=A0ABW2L9Q3_9BACT
MKRGRPREFDAEEVLERGVEFFWTHGYRGAGLTELLKHLGIGRQSFYDSFGNKREFYQKAIDHYRSTRLAHVLGILQGPGSPLENVRTAVRFFEALARDEKQRGCFVANAMLEMQSEDDELRGFLDETMGMLENGYRDALTKAKKQGELKAGDPKALARALTNSSIGLAVTGRLGQSHEVIADIYAGTLAMLR